MMWKRSLFAFAALGVLGFSEAHAASRGFQNERARKDFSALLGARAGSGGVVKASAVREPARVASASAGRLRAADVAALNPRVVRLFDARLTRYIRRFGVVRAPLSDFLPGASILYRQKFLVERFTPDAAVGGVFFTASATPSGVGAVNIYAFFPVLRRYGAPVF